MRVSKREEAINNKKKDSRAPRSLAIGMSLSGPKKKSAIRPMTPISAQPRPNKPICAPETEVRLTATCGRSGEAVTTGSAAAARTRDDASAGSAAGGEKAAAAGEQSARKRPTRFCIDERFALCQHGAC